MRSTRNRTNAFVAALVAALSLLATACGGDSGAEVTSDGKTVIRYQGWASQVGLAELAEDLGYYEKVDLEWVGDTTSGPQDIQSVATGQVDVGGAFNGAVVKLAAADAPLISVLGYYGADDQTYSGYYVLDGSPIRSARDLIGKKVGMNTLGAHHEFLVREWLAQQGLAPEEIAQVELTVVPPVNTEEALRQGQIDVGTLNGVFRDTALARGGLRPLFTDQSLFGSFTYGTQVFRRDFVDQNREAVADYVQGTSRAIRWTQTQPREVVVQRFKDIIDKRGRNENTQFVEYWKSVGVAGPGGVIDEREIQIWIDWLVRNGELQPGQLTASDLYTNEFVPYANGTYPADSGPNGEPGEAR
jgi:ABC-type nitrate/sulfonate/bicarbonate transport system substrate-binding protein